MYSSRILTLALRSRGVAAPLGRLLLLLPLWGERWREAGEGCSAGVPKRPDRSRLGVLLAAAR